MLRLWQEAKLEIAKGGTAVKVQCRKKFCVEALKVQFNVTSLKFNVGNGAVIPFKKYSALGAGVPKNVPLSPREIQGFGAWAASEFGYSPGGGFQQGCALLLGRAQTSVNCFTNIVSDPLSRPLNAPRSKSNSVQFAPKHFI